MKKRMTILALLLAGAVTLGSYGMVQAGQEKREVPVAGVTQTLAQVLKEAGGVQAQTAERIYKELMDAGVEVLLDDRKERPGVKFKDADLLGIPVRLTVGRGAPEGKIEYKLRRDAEKEELSVDEGIARAIRLINSEK